MKLLQLLILSFIATSILFSQKVYEKGYFIDNLNQKVECYIRNSDWLDNPDRFQYKIDSTGNSNIKSISEVKEFAFKNGNKYLRASIEIDTSLLKVSQLDYVKQPKWKSDIVFLKTLIEGKANLYYYKGDELVRFFYNSDSLPIKQLVYKQYLTGNSIVAENKTYIGQLRYELSCKDNLDINNLRYQKKALVNYFSKYNLCIGVEPKNYTVKKKVNLNLKIVAGINYSSLNFYTTSSCSFKPQPTILFGLEMETIFPFNENRWSIILEPVYGYYKPEEEATSIASTTYADFKYIEVQMGIRYSYYINQKLKLYFNPMFIYTMPINTELGTKTNYTSFSGQIYYEVSNMSSMAFGLGCNYKRFCIEFKYFLKRDLLHEYLFYYAHFKNISISMKYTFYKTKQN